MLEWLAQIISLSHSILRDRNQQPDESTKGEVLTKELLSPRSLRLGTVAHGSLLVSQPGSSLNAIPFGHLWTLPYIGMID